MGEIFFVVSLYVRFVILANAFQRLSNFWIQSNGGATGDDDDFIHTHTSSRDPFLSRQEMALALSLWEYLFLLLLLLCEMFEKLLFFFFRKSFSSVFNLGFMKSPPNVERLLTNRIPFSEGFLGWWFLIIDGFYESDGIGLPNVFRFMKIVSEVFFRAESKTFQETFCKIWETAGQHLGMWTKRARASKKPPVDSS